LNVNYWGEWTWQWISLQQQTTQQSQFAALILYINNQLQTPQSTSRPQEDRLGNEQDKSSNASPSASDSTKTYYKSIYTSNQDPTALTKANISDGIFTLETLGMINRNRLKSTPPPSENEYDEEVVKNACDNALLGKWGEDTDSEEDSLFE
jgi:hypothetical protein